MDSVFLLSRDARGRFLRSAARALGCAYICLWSYLPHPSNFLVSMDGWFHEDETAQPSSSSGSLPKRLFDAYRTSFCPVDSGRVPGLAYKAGLPYVELGGSELMDAASMQVQQQFYQEAGIKTAVFMGCKEGEIELGMSTSSNNNMNTSIQKWFAEDYVQQFQFGEFVTPDQSRPSSSSSSLRSLSVGSPEYSSLILTKASTSFMPDTVKEATVEQATQLPHQMAMQTYSRYQNVQIPSPARDDAEMTRAMVAVLSSYAAASASASSPPQLLYQPPLEDQSYQSRMNRPVGAFKRYNSLLAPKFEFKPSLRSQRMIKAAVSILRRMNLIRLGSRVQEARPTSNQLHHMISERKRREKINESFHALRMLLPPGSKKDKVSVLANTRNYVNTLIAQISELEERNRSLEMQLPPSDEVKDVGGASDERVAVQIIRASESTSEMQQISLRILVREECDMLNLVLHILECLKEMGSITLKSVDATTYSPQANISAQATITIQVKTSEWDEESFKEAVTRAVDSVARPTPANP